ncbi:hypothetical protein LCGC14_0970890 [marine sediment metagenome]|uniref:Uncharacterized protein n=1 Tax=marine sediment metagenome TaxID=412755 RepID=A0A0F9QUV6_9ZZZZ
MVIKCWVEDGRGVEACRDCGLILNDDAVCGCEDLPNSIMNHTRKERRAYSLKGGYVTALQKKMQGV